MRARWGLRGLVVLGAATALSGCAAGPQRLACPTGQSEVRTAQIFLGPAKVSDADLRRFVDTEVASRFHDGVTVVDGGGQWKGDANRMIREASKVLLIVLPNRGDPHRRVEAVRTAWRSKSGQDSVVVLPPPACVAL